jgi:hypothetical protein
VFFGRKESGIGRKEAFLQKKDFLENLLVKNINCHVFKVVDKVVEGDSNRS